MKKTVTIFIALGLVAAATGCGADASETLSGSAAPDEARAGGAGGAGDAGGAAGICYSDSECGYGYVCSSGRCIFTGGGATDAGAGRPDIGPEKPVYVPSPPVASKNYVYVLNAQNGTVVRINPADLTVKSIKVGSQPKALLTIKGTDTAVVLNTGSRTVTVIRTENQTDRIVNIDVGARYHSIAISPSGRHVIAYDNTRDLTTDDLIGEEKMAVIDLGSGDEASVRVVDRNAGADVTDVFFSTARNEAYVLSKSAVQIIPFDSLDTYETPPQIRLGDDDFIKDIPHRTAQAAGDSDYILIRGTASKELLVFDRGRITDLGDPEAGNPVLHVDLGGIPTDLQTTPGATHAVAVLRDEAQLKIIAIPDGFADPSAVRTVDLGGYLVGTLRIAHDAGRDQVWGLLYTTAQYDEHLLLVDIYRPENLEYLGNGDNLNKAIFNTVVAPDGLSAIIIHERAPTAKEGTDYDKQRDLAEGFSIFKIRERVFSFTETPVKPGVLAFSDSGHWGAVTVEDAGSGTHELHLLNLRQPTSRSELLDTKAIFVGALTRADGKDVFYVTQEHYAGRITFIALPAVGEAEAEIRTVTGFEISSEDE